MNVVRNWTQLKKVNLSLLEIILSYWPKYLTSWKFDKTCPLYSKLMFMSLALMFKIQNSCSLSFFLWCKTIYLLTSICDKLLDPKYIVFVKLSHVKLFLWVKIYKWAQTETSNSSSTVSVLQWYFENRNISVGLWQRFWQFMVRNGFRFSSKSVLFS